MIAEAEDLVVVVQLASDGQATRREVLLAVSWLRHGVTVAHLLPEVAQQVQGGGSAHEAA